MKIIHITDPHLVGRSERLHGLSPYQRLTACIDDVLAHHQDAAACVVTGDLTHRGELAGYQALAEQLGRLPMPVFPLMGNHDIRAVFRSVFPAALDDGSGHVQGVVRLGMHSLVMLDTLAEGQSAGLYDAGRLAWLHTSLEQESILGQRVLLFQHHPFFPIGIPCLDRISLRDPDALAQLVEQYPCIQHLFFGHVHRPVCGSWKGLPYSTMRGLNHQVPFDLVTSYPVPKSHEPPAYAVAFVDLDRVVVHFHDFLDRSVYVPQT